MQALGIDPLNPYAVQESLYCTYRPGFDKSCSFVVFSHFTHMHLLLLVEGCRGSPQEAMGILL